MPALTRPTLSELMARTRGDISGRLGDSALRRSVEAIFGNVIAATAHGLYGHLEWLGRQLFPQHAEIEGLLEWGDWLDVPRKQGARAVGQVQFTSSLGDPPVPLGTLLTDGAGALYMTGTQAGPLRYALSAVQPGTAQNLGSGESLYLASPLAGVDGVAATVAELSGGSDAEDVELYRARVLDGLRQGGALTGAAGDYKRWTLRRDGVTRAWEHDRRMGPGTVSVGFVFDGRTSIIPTPDDVLAMQTYLDSVRPADMLRVYVAPPIACVLDLQVTARGAMLPSQMESALRDFLRAEAELEAPVSMSQLDEVLSGVSGEVSHAITAITLTERGMVRSVSPAASEVQPGPWGLLEMGTLQLTVVPP